MNLHEILIKPITTEKSSREASQAKYSFIVHDMSTKIDIKNAIKKLYGVEAESVRIIMTKPKYRSGTKRATIQKKAVQKKAIITLKDKKKTIDVNKFSKEKQ